MTKRTTQTKLTIYRRHASSCPTTDASRLDACECPLWVHGKVRGRFLRQTLDTRTLATAVVNRDDLISRRNDDPTHDDNSVHLVNHPKTDISIEVSIHDFLASKARKSGNTLKIYTEACDHFSRFCKAQDIVLLKHIDKTHVQAYLDDYASSRTRNTAQGRLTHLRVWFNYCVRERRWLAHSPAESRDLNFSKKGKTGNGQERLPFSPSEITAILAAVEQVPEADRDRTRALILLLLYTGMRISDATFIERSYIDPNAYLQYWIIKTHKYLNCSLWLHPCVIAALDKLPASRIYFFQPDEDSDYRKARLALHQGGKFDEAMPDYTVRIRETTALVLRVLKLAGLSGACHRFRDTFAINMLRGNGTEAADIYTVCEFLGHSDVRITKEHYLKFIPGYAERIAQRTRVLDYQFPQEP